MANIPAFSYLQSDESVFKPFNVLPLPSDADLFETADHCAALVIVLIETDDTATCTALCERLLYGLRHLRELCDADLPPHLIAQLIAG